MLSFSHLAKASGLKLAGENAPVSSLTSSAQYLQLEQEVTTLTLESCRQLDPIEGTMLPGGYTASTFPSRADFTPRN